MFKDKEVETFFVPTTVCLLCEQDVRRRLFQFFISVGRAHRLNNGCVMESAPAAGDAGNKRRWSRSSTLLIFYRISQEAAQSQEGLIILEERKGRKNIGESGVFHICIPWLEDVFTFRFQPDQKGPDRINIPEKNESQTIKQKKWALVKQCKTQTKTKLWAGPNVVAGG